MLTATIIKTVHLTEVWNDGNVEQISLSLGQLNIFSLKEKLLHT